MKKIAIVADGWRRYINYAWISGCRQYIKEKKLDAQLYVFYAFGNFSKDEKYNQGEYNIITLPDFRQFDGIIVELTNVLKRKYARKIIDTIRTSKVPAVSLLERIPGLYFAGIDNYSAMKEIVEHLVTVHGCRKINFVGGPQYVSENHDRLQAYIDVLQQHGILVEDARILHRDYEVESGVWAFEQFQELEQKTEAYVCANENIAVGLCHRAQELGYKIPEDFFVTGFDDFSKASYYKPKITTVAYTQESIAYAAVELLNQIWNGQAQIKENFAPTHPVFQESCGCKAKNSRKRSQYVADSIFREVREIDLHNELMDLKRNLLECTSYEQMAERLFRCFQGLQCKEMYMFMNTDLVEAQKIEGVQNQAEAYVTDGYPEKMTLIFGSKNGIVSEKTNLIKKELFSIMEEKTKSGMYLFSPIHFREREIGYLVLSDCDYMLENQFLFETLNTFTESLEYLYGKIVLRRANNKLEKLYILDSLTGLYNRMAYTELAEPLFENCKKEKRPVTIMFIDADHLKYINDIFGHDMGNIAIKSIADAIRKCSPVQAVNMRYGGDEFVLVLPDFDEKRARQLYDKFPETLTHIAEKCNVEFPIEASLGYVVVDDYDRSINDYINDADEKMYANKKARKAERV